MFIHGARAVLLRVKHDTAGLGHWVHQLEARAPRNKVIVAIANKLARIASGVVSRRRLQTRGRSRLKRGMN
jgi:transposase